MRFQQDAALLLASQQYAMAFGLFGADFKTTFGIRALVSLLFRGGCIFSGALQLQSHRWLMSCFYCIYKR